MGKEIQKHEEQHHHPGTTAAEDSELTLWLNRLWARNEPPQRIEVWQLVGRNKAMRGEMIFHENYSLDTRLNIEQANQLANDIWSAAQSDCDSCEARSWYQIAVIDTTKKASPLTKRLGPLEPKRSYAVSKNGSHEDLDDEETSAKSLDLRLIKEGLEHNRWNQGNNYRVFGEMLLLQDSIIRNQQGTVDRLMNQIVNIFDRLQESKDRELDRETVRNRETVKVRMMEDGLRAAYNLLPGLFASKGNGAAASLPANGAQAALPTTTTGREVPTNYGPSPERALVENFMIDVERAKIDIKLFGHYVEKDDKYLLLEPGVFSAKQFATLYGVRTGDFPPSALDVLMPGSGNELEITQEQMKAAQEAGVTEGMGMAIMQLVALRRQAQESSLAQQAQTQQAQEAR